MPPVVRSGPGLDVPDARGRTGLDRVGRDLTGNPDVVVRDVELLASGWHVLRRTTLDQRDRHGRWSTVQRETYDRGDGATILLYDPTRRTVLLTRQFRFPVYVSGHPDGLLLETAAGLLDEDDPLTAVRRETAEELGVVLDRVEHLFDLWTSPGSVTERVHFYAAEYRPQDRTGAGGGVAEEGEEVEVVEMSFDEALAGIATGAVADAKTVVLLQWAALSGPFRRLGGSARRPPRGRPACGPVRRGWRAPR